MLKRNQPMAVIDVLKSGTVVSAMLLSLNLQIPGGGKVC